MIIRNDTYYLNEYMRTSKMGKYLDNLSKAKIKQYLRKLSAVENRTKYIIFK